MKIDIPDLPERSGNGNVYVFRNMELVARKLFSRPWEVKTQACNHCGACCKHYREYWANRGLPMVEGYGCDNLKQRKDGTWWCDGSLIPIHCLLSNPPDKECSIIWENI
jgi:hypothetical protein